jgi:hypothetical protein
MRTILNIAFALVLTASCAAWAYGRYAAPDEGLPTPAVDRESCCAPGADCCFPGSPCCGDSCCAPGADCCFPGSPCCGDNDCCAQGLACCTPVSECCTTPHGSCCSK